MKFVLYGAIGVAVVVCCPFLKADATDIGKFGHVVSNKSSHKVHVYADIAGAKDAEHFIEPGNAWKTGKTGKINSFEVRDDESGMLITKVTPAEDGGQYQLLLIDPGENDGKFVGNDIFTEDEVRSRYQFTVHRLHDRF